MSAAKTEPVTTRYEGLVRTAQELFDTHESSGWRLANVIYDGIEELRAQGYVVSAQSGDPADRKTARAKLSRDLGRHGMGPSSVHRHYLTWKRYGSGAKRIPGITFSDHMSLVRKLGIKNPGHHAAVSALQGRAADIAAGRRTEFGNADATVAAAVKGTAAGQSHNAKLSILDEIISLAHELKAKPWKIDAANAACVICGEPIRVTPGTGRPRITCSTACAAARRTHRNAQRSAS